MQDGARHAYGLVRQRQEVHLPRVCCGYIGDRRSEEQALTPSVPPAHPSTSHATPAYHLFSGAAIFKLNEDNDAPVKNTELAGIMFIVVYMGMDSFTSNWQSKIFKEYGVESTLMMMYTNLFSSGFTGVHPPAASDTAPFVLCMPCACSYKHGNLKCSCAPGCHV